MFFIFGIISLIASVFVIVFIKETSGLSDLEKKNLNVSNLNKSDSLISNENETLVY